MKNPFLSRACESLVGDCPEFYRASGECVCTICGELYYDHKPHDSLDFDGNLWLTVICNGDVVKL